jgi:hypothetical protein
MVIFVQFVGTILASGGVFIVYSDGLITAPYIWLLLKLFFLDAFLPF